jgi:uncharacterized membrane protein YeiH
MSWGLALDLLGTFFFAISGSLLAAKRGFDIVASLLLGSLTGLGGGVVRDLIIGRPPAAFDEPVHLIPPVLATIVVFFMSGHVQRFWTTILVFDAVGLAVFCTTGAVTALDHGMNPIASLLLGVTTAVGGGLMRDVVANHDPQLFNPRDLYAVPAFAGSALVVLIWQLGGDGDIALYSVTAAVLAFRLLSLKFAWRVPNAHRGRATTRGED